MKTLTKLCNKALLVMLAILGFSSCNEKETADEYGTPYAHFIINGNVKSKATNNPIEGIKVNALSESTHTDEIGAFQLIISSFPKNQDYSVNFSDVDDSLNGKFEDEDTLIQFIYPEFTGGSGWYSGETEKNIEIKLNPDTE